MHRFALALLAFSLATPAVAQSADDCAALAASPFEPGYEDIGVADGPNFFPYDAREACAAALTADPGNLAIKAWLGRACAANGEAGKAVPLLEAAAGAGNVLALRTLGDLLILGDGIAPDKARGVDLLRRAADAGFAPAALSLAYSYDFGDGVAADAATALAWYLKAAEGGMGRAQAIVGEHYRTGKGGVAVSDQEAFRWFARAAESQDPEGQYQLGVAYLEGRGTAPDEAKALAAFQASADQYYGKGSNALGYMTEEGLGLDADIAAAGSLYYSAKAHNVVLGAYNLARLKSRGEVDAQPGEVRNLYRKAAMAGEPRAAVNLALMELRGEDGPVDVADALKWTRRAADAGNAIALNNLGRMFELGLGTDADLAMALDYYRRAAAAGDPTAADNLKRLGG